MLPATSPIVESARWIEADTVSARDVSSRAVPTSCSPAAPSSVTALLDSSTAMRRSWIDSLIFSECEYTELIDWVSRCTSATWASVSDRTDSRAASSSPIPAPSPAVARRERVERVLDRARDVRERLEHLGEFARCRRLPSRAPFAARARGVAERGGGAAHLRAHELREREAEREHDQRDRERRAQWRVQRRSPARACAWPTSAFRIDGREHERRHEQAQRPRERQRARDVRALRERHARARAPRPRAPSRAPRAACSRRPRAGRAPRTRAGDRRRAAARRLDGSTAMPTTRTAIQTANEPAAKRPARAMRARRGRRWRRDRRRRAPRARGSRTPRRSRCRARSRRSALERDAAAARRPSRVRPARARATPPRTRAASRAWWPRSPRTAETGSVPRAPLASCRPQRNIGVPTSTGERSPGAPLTENWRWGICPRHGSARACSATPRSRPIRRQSGATAASASCIAAACRPRPGSAAFMNADCGSSAPLRRSR